MRCELAPIGFARSVHEITVHPRPASPTTAISVETDHPHVLWIDVFPPPRPISFLGRPRHRRHIVTTAIRKFHGSSANHHHCSVVCRSIRSNVQRREPIPTRWQVHPWPVGASREAPPCRVTASSASDGRIRPSLAEEAVTRQMETCRGSDAEVGTQRVYRLPVRRDLLAECLVQLDVVALEAD